MCHLSDRQGLFPHCLHCPCSFSCYSGTKWLPSIPLGESLYRLLVGSPASFVLPLGNFLFLPAAFQIRGRRVFVWSSVLSCLALMKNQLLELCKVNFSLSLCYSFPRKRLFFLLFLSTVFAFTVVAQQCTLSYIPHALLLYMSVNMIVSGSFSSHY